MTPAEIKLTLDDSHQSEIIALQYLKCEGSETSLQDCNFLLGLNHPVIAQIYQQMGHEGDYEETRETDPDVIIEMVNSTYMYPDYEYDSSWMACPSGRVVAVSCCELLEIIPCHRHTCTSKTVQ